jgi:predicted phosphate transport protein (TIGR00153 family)
MTNGDPPAAAAAPLKGGRQMRTTSPIAGLFGKSPFKPMQEHMKAVRECVAQTLPLFEALRDGDREKLLAAKEEIFKLEQEADDIKNEIRSRLPKGLFMPVDRRDLLDLLNAQDSIADTAQDVAGLLVLRDMQIPEALKGLLLPFVQRTLDAVEQCAEVINELDELVEMGFRGRAGERVEEMVSALNAIEADSDDLEMDLARTLFDHEDTLKPLSVIFWYEQIQHIGDIADYAEDVGDRVRLLIAR